MIDPVDGKIIYPYSKCMWARSVDNEIKLIRITENTCTFLDMIDGLYKTTGLKLIDIDTHSVLFPELFFEDCKCNEYTMVFYNDHCWNIQTGRHYLNSKAMREAVLPFLEFLDEHAVGVDYKMVKEYLGLNDKKEASK